jgi:penicillin-binding protein 2
MAHQNFTPIIRIVTTLTAGVFVLLAARVLDLQGLQGEFFWHISENNRQFRADIPAERGVFLDRYGDPLVLNTRSYFRYTNPLELYPQTELLAQSEALLAQVTDPLAVGYALQRLYLRPFSLAHVLGYISGVTAEDLAHFTHFKLTDSVGRSGLEQAYDPRLRGSDGYQDFEINALGQKQAVQAKSAPRQGQLVSTTLDPYLSTAAWRAMGNKTGAVVILDAETGDVLSLVSTPSFNSNLFAPGDETGNAQRVQLLQEALTDERQLFFNRAVSGTYPPGSVFKLVTAVAALENQAVDVNTTVDDQGVIEVGGSQYANWYYTQYGRTEGLISLVRALSRSNDIYFYKAAEWTGPDALAQKAREFGFGEPTGIEIPGERGGLVPDPEWKERTIGERWFLGNTYHFGIGQGDVLVTPLQLAHMVAAFGNNGQICKPTLLTDAEVGQTDRQCASLGMSDATLEAIQEGMIGACSAGGTAFPFFDWNTQRLSELPESLPVGESIRRGMAACKTGTAEFGGTDERGYRKTHAWFGMVIGGIPELLKAETEAVSVNEAATATAASAVVTEENTTPFQERQKWLQRIQAADFPRTLAVVVLVESDEQQPYAEGSREAAPVAREIVNWMMGAFPETP